MEAKAKVQFVRISPRKVKIVLDLVRGKKVADAAAILKHTPKAASEYVYKLVKSAAANAEHNFQMDTSKLYVSECFVCQGHMKYNKRRNPRAKGSADRILKRTSHVTIVVKERV